ncbi:countin-3-like [Branchiostoma floridae]|uniref:Countin-3-like n=1 Tax=Branchiostoma floridae TaxID=7739 RepID=A0A9J7LE31_BRAFL|nr:countin-3-like [Branchiostoma floridae]
MVLAVLLAHQCLADRPPPRRQAPLVRTGGSWSLSSRASKPSNVNDRDKCKFCVDFAHNAIQTIGEAILEGGLTQGCEKLCSIVANKTGSQAVGLACDGLCALVGFDEFVHAFEKADVDPIYYCELLKQCPIVDNGDATITKLTVTPKSGPQGDFLIDMEYETKNGTGTGELLIYVDPVDGLPLGASFLNEPQDPGKYDAQITLHAVPQQGCEVACESFEPGVYNVTMHVCNGQCMSHHPHSKIYDKKKTNFTITGPAPTDPSRL